jgi:4-oxalocrotonate tautomerase
MPTIRVEMLEGRTPQQRTALVKALTQACVDALGSKPESVDVLLFDIPKQNWATGGLQWDQPRPQS